MKCILLFIIAFSFPTLSQADCTLFLSRSKVSTENIADGSPASPYLRLLKFTLDALGEVEQQTLDHLRLDQVQLKVLLLQRVLQSAQPVSVLSELNKISGTDLSHHSVRLSTLADSNQFDNVVESLTDADWKSIQQAVQIMLSDLKDLQATREVVKPKTQFDFEDQPDSNGDTLLHRLIRNSRFAEVKAIFENPNLNLRYVNHRNSSSHTAIDLLHYLPTRPPELELFMKSRGALTGDQLDALDARFNQIIFGPDDDSSQLEKLYRRGVDIQGPKDYSKRTPLTVAVESNKRNVALELLRLGADPNFSISRSLDSPLLIGIKYGSPIEVISALIEKGADLSQLDSSGSNAFTLAYLKGRADIMKLLARSGASTKFTGEEQFIDSKLSGEKVVEALIQLGIDLNSKFEDGNSLLHHAAEAPSCSYTKYLLESGADPMITNSQGLNLEEFFSHFCELDDELRPEDAQILKLIQKHTKKRREKHER